MKPNLKNCIYNIYMKQDFETFITKCKEKLGFELEFMTEVSSLCQEVKNISFDNDPAVEFRILVNKCAPKEINIAYTTILTISKITKYYYLQHEFSLENPDIDKMDTYLEAFRDEPYNKKQFLLEEKIIDFLNKYGYSRLSYAEIEEVCNGIPQFKDDEESQMTVGNAIFMDFWELNE